jgi:hypothetical protein
MFEGELAGVGEEHVDDGTLGRGQDDVGHELLALSRSSTVRISSRSAGGQYSGSDGTTRMLPYNPNSCV